MMELAITITIIMTMDILTLMTMNTHMITAIVILMDIITIIFNNQTLGMVRQWQTLCYNKRYSQTDLDDRGPDFVRLAQAYGLTGRRVNTVEQLEEALQEALHSQKGCVIDCAIQKDEMVRPMVAAGRRITDFLVD